MYVYCNVKCICLVCAKIKAMHNTWSMLAFTAYQLKDNDAVYIAKVY